MILMCGTDAAIKKAALDTAADGAQRAGRSTPLEDAAGATQPRKVT